MNQRTGRNLAALAASALLITVAWAAPASSQRPGVGPTKPGAGNGIVAPAPTTRWAAPRPKVVPTDVAPTYDLVPMFKVEALGFTAVNESGADFLGSDEIWVVWSSQQKLAGTYVFDDVDTGEYRAFHQYQSCIYPMAIGSEINGRDNDGWECVEGGARGPVEFDVSFYEQDVYTPFSYCFVLRSAGSPLGECVDDWLGTYRHSMTTAELVAVLPTPGSTKNYRMAATDCPDDQIWGDGYFDAEYEIEFRDHPDGRSESRADAARRVSEGRSVRRIPRSQSDAGRFGWRRRVRVPTPRPVPGCRRCGRRSGRRCGTRRPGGTTNR